MVHLLTNYKSFICSKVNNAIKKLGVALMGRNRTGLPCSVGRLTAHPPGPAAADRPHARRPAELQTIPRDDANRWCQQTTTTDNSEQNNTGSLGGPVIMAQKQLDKTCGICVVLPLPVSPIIIAVEPRSWLSCCSKLWRALHTGKLRRSLFSCSQRTARSFEPSALVAVVSIQYTPSLVSINKPMSFLISIKLCF